MKHNTRHWVGITAGILSLAGYAPAATLGSEKYTYDASGNIIEKSIDGVVTKMSFDRSNRLTEFQTAGQAKQSTAYDAAGRPVATKDQDGQTTRSMSYGYGDKVLETQTRDSKAGFFYNAAGQLVGRNVEGTVSTYTWDGNVLAAEGAEAFANEAHISGGVPIIDSGGDVVVSDHLGNTLVYGDCDFKGTAFGEGQEHGRFTGKIFVEELNGFFFPCRLYSPESGSWTVADPIGFPNGRNNYAYVGGDPISRCDPLGLITWTDGGPDYTSLPAPKLGETSRYTEIPDDLSFKSVPDGDCFRPEKDTPVALTATTNVEITTEGLMEPFGGPLGGHVTGLTQSETVIHESWHVTHHHTLVHVSMEALETWHANYSGNKFSGDGAEIAGAVDCLVNLNLAAALYVTHANRSGGHEMRTSPIDPYVSWEGEWGEWRVNNPNWGGPLNTYLGTRFWTASLVAGNCE